MSIQNPRRNWHDPKHFLNKNISFEECSRNSAKKKKLSCLSARTHLHCFFWRIRKSNYSPRSFEWPELMFTWLRLELSRQHVTSFHITKLLEMLPLKHIWKTCSNTETVSCFVPQFICPRRLLYLVCIVGVQWRSFFVFFLTWISSSSSIAFS